MSKYEELKYVLSGATDWGYEYAKKEDVEAAFAELEECHAMELDQWVLELGKIKLENERLKKDIDTLKTAWEQSQSALSTIAALKLAAEEKLRATRRALWIAHAYKAKFKRWWLHFALDYEASMIHPDIKTINRIKGKIGNCEKSERKCRAKAEEYK